MAPQRRLGCNVCQARGISGATYPQRLSLRGTNILYDDIISSIRRSVISSIKYNTTYIHHSNAVRRRCTSTSMAVYSNSNSFIVYWYCIPLTWSLLADNDSSVWGNTVGIGCRLQKYVTDTFIIIPAQHCIVNPKTIDTENPRSVEEIKSDLEEIPDYWGFGFFGEHDLMMELAAAYAEQDEDEWGDSVTHPDLEELYPEVTDGTQ